jgi:hypothetical protein
MQCNTLDTGCRSNKNIKDIEKKLEFPKAYFNKNIETNI